MSKKQHPFYDALTRSLSLLRMKFFKEENIAKINFFSSIILVILLTTMLGAIFIRDKFQNFHTDLRSIEKNYLDQHKEQNRFIVLYQLDRIEARRQMVKKKLKKNLQNRVNEALAIAQNIYETNKDRRTLEEIKGLIREALRPIRFNNNRGYFFIKSMQNNSHLLYPPDPSLETICGEHDDPYPSEAVHDLIRIGREQGKGFYEYEWPKPGGDPKEVYKKLSFVSVFKPLGWLIGTGEYVEDFQRKTKNGIINVLSQSMTNNPDNYIFVYQLHNINGGKNFATMLVNPNRPDLVGQTISDSCKDARGKEFRKEFLKDLREKGESFVTYWYKKPGSEEPGPKISYFKLYPQWNWIVARGVYLDELEQLMAARKDDLHQQVKENLVQLFAFLLICLGVVILIAQFFSEKMQLIFDDYKMRQKKHQDLLLQAKNEWERTFDAMPDMICILNKKHEIVRANKAMANVLGKSFKELLHLPCYRLMHCTSEPPGFCPHSLLLKDHQEHHAEVYEETLDVYLDVTVSPLFDREGQLNGAVHIARDISDKKKQEVELQWFNENLQRMVEEQTLEIKDSKRLLQGLFNAAPIGIGIIKDRVLQLVNPKGEEQLGWEPRDLIGKSTDIIYRDQAEFERVGREIKKQLEKQDTASIETQLRKKDGSLLDVLISLNPVDSSHPEGEAVFAVLDISDRKNAEKQMKKAQQQLLHAAKLSAVGSLSASIAHEFNNPLCGVVNVLNRIARKDCLADADAEFMQLAISECERMKRLIQDLQNFHRPSSGERRDVDMHRAIDTVLLLLKKDLKNKRVTVVKKFSDNSLRLYGVEDQIKQVLLNLIKNGGEAMAESGGILTITTLEFDKKLIVRIHDNGMGIPAENMAHLFEPFFTTKSAVKGTGLGLSVTYGIVQSHGGTLDVYSEAEQGTAFILALPIDQRQTESKY